MDWKAFLDKHNVEYVTYGKNVSSDPNEVGIKCPFCEREGRPDPSQHMNLNVRTGAYICWRSQQRHRGKNPVRLVAALFNINYRKAKDLVDAESTSIEGSILGIIKDKLNPKEEQNLTTEITLPSYYTPIHYKYSRLKPARSYLKQRGFPTPEQLAKTYDLRMPMKGDFANHIVVPLYEDGNLVCLQGRSLAKEPKLRYRGLSKRNTLDGMKAIHATNETLFNYDAIQNDENMRWLVITEGVFDALKLDWFGRDQGLRSTCVFTKNMSTRQKRMLAQVVENAENLEAVYVMLDANERTDQQHMVSQLSHIPAMNAPVTPEFFDAKDPAEFNEQDVLDFVDIIQGNVEAA